ncbi:hypothetical protein CU098_011958 [Rhizopus stolonifer]|uniref:Uncharacterized protein n=1 Tax=Rhizopus stolonifer TaxID=4846 RepID=A0A367KJ53_RHIST|nr:hypothetical protein CU098_011958 [Rhizopus stolonifer]
MRHLFDHRKEHKTLKLAKKLQEEADREWEQETAKRREQELNDEAIAKALQAQLEQEQQSPIHNVPPPLPTKPRAYASPPQGMAPYHSSTQPALPPRQPYRPELQISSPSPVFHTPLVALDSQTYPTSPPPITMPVPTFKQETPILHHPEPIMLPLQSPPPLDTPSITQPPLPLNTTSITHPAVPYSTNNPYRIPVKPKFSDSVLSFKPNEEDHPVPKRPPTPLGSATIELGRFSDDNDEEQEEEEDTAVDPFADIYDIHIPQDPLATTAILKRKESKEAIEQTIRTYQEKESLESDSVRVYPTKILKAGAPPILSFTK